MDKEMKQQLQALTSQKLQEVSRFSPQEKAALMAKAVKFSRNVGLVTTEEWTAMQSDRELAAKVGRRSVVDLLNWESLQELKGRKPEA